MIRSTQMGAPLLFKSRPWVLVPLLALAISTASLVAAPVRVDPGQSLYRNGIYDLSAIHYMRELEARNDTPFNKQMLSLSLMRLGKFAESLRWLNGDDFTSSYLRLFAEMKSSRPEEGFGQWRFILQSDRITDVQKDYASLLAGALYLETGDYRESREHFERIVRLSRSDDVRNTGRDILASLDRYSKRPRKNPILAGVLSAILPGSGQVYSDHTVDGITVFFFNALFLGSAAYANQLETAARRPHTGSVLLGTVGAVFYLSGITGAAASANRFNLYEERLFQQEIRERYLNLDAVERSSGIVIRASY